MSWSIHFSEEWALNVIWSIRIYMHILGLYSWHTLVSHFQFEKTIDYCLVASLNLQDCTEMHEREMHAFYVHLCVFLHIVLIIHNMYMQYCLFHCRISRWATFHLHLQVIQNFFSVCLEDWEVGIWLQSVETSIVVMYHSCHCFKMKVRYTRDQ